MPSEYARSRLVYVPGKLMGRIIGRGGEGLKAFESTSANLVLDVLDSRSAVRVMHFDDAGCVAKVAQLLQKRVEEEEPTVRDVVFHQSKLPLVFGTRGETLQALNRNP